MDKRVAIHNRPGSFSDRWVAFCESTNMPYKLVSCYDTDIIYQIRDCDALLWHFTHDLPLDIFMARHVIQAAEALGIKVFPSIQTCWHYDDKVAQKYLLESVGAPTAESYVFYNHDECVAWLESRASYPLVFKLRRGAGSANVRLLPNTKGANKIANRMFSTGIKPVAGITSDISHKLKKIGTLEELTKKMVRLPKNLYTIWLNNKLMGREIGYAYFQEFLPNNKYDTRITIIGNRAFGFTRGVRPGDFRASGSGLLDYESSKIDLKCITIAFETAIKIGAQSMAFDFVYDKHDNPRIIEISYVYMADAVRKCPGHWDQNLNWYSGHVWPQDAILDDILNA